jgi:hypothetical protein
MQTQEETQRADDQKSTKRREGQHIRPAAANPEQPGPLIRHRQAEHRPGEQRDTDDHTAQPRSGPQGDRSQPDGRTRHHQQVRPPTRTSAVRPYRQITSSLAVNRSSIGVQFWSRSPMYSLSGRINRLSACCSITWAVHPAIRLIEKTGVNRSVGIPR